MASMPTITVRVQFDNQKAARAFGRVLEVLESVAEDMPWRDDVKDAVKAGRYARKHIEVNTVDDGTR